MPHIHLPKEDWCLLGCQGTESPSKASLQPPGDSPIWTGHPDLRVVTYLVLSPMEGRVEGCSEHNLAGGC